VVDTTERVLRLLGLLQERAVWTGPELAERLDVTTRSVRRDVERLRALGYPVHATQGVGGGYRLGAGKALPPLLLDDDEAIATVISLRLAAGGTVAGASEAAVRTLAKLDQVLPTRLRSEVRALHDAITTLAGGRVEVDADDLLVLARASRDHVRVDLTYAAPERPAAERRVEPYGLVATGRRWYLLAFDPDRDDWRTLRLDRMSDVRATTWRFRPRVAPEPAAYVQRAVTVSPYPHEARVLVHAPAAVVREQITPGSGSVEEVDAHTCRVVAGARSPEALLWHFGTLGHAFTIDGPEELRAAAESFGGRLLGAIS
jgi:predicted DNA-binding transcriptional regulator YafY